MGKIIRNTLILTIITVVAGLGLGLVYEVTKEPIARTEEQAKKEAWQTVFSDVSLEDFKAVDVDKEAADKTVADLGINFLAAGIGNIHGKYPANWKGLSFETLDAIQKLTGEMPLVLHGGTGIPADMIKKAIDLGVSKINVNTECQLSFAAATRKYIEEGKDQQGKGYDPRKLLKPGAEAIQATVKEKMELFGSVGKAE